MAWSFPSHRSWSMTGLQPSALQGRPCARVMPRPLSVPVSCSPFHAAASRGAVHLAWLMTASQASLGSSSFS